MSDNIRIDNMMPVANGDNNEQLVEISKNAISEKFKDNNEAAATTAGNDINEVVTQSSGDNQQSTNTSIENGSEIITNGEELKNEPKNNLSENSNTATIINDNNQTIGVNGVANNSLSLLAQYDSQDSSSSSDESSSDGETSDSDSSTKSSSMDSDNSPISSIRSEKSLDEIRKKLDEFQEGDDDDEDVEEKRNREPIKAIGELGIEDLPPIEDLYITVPEKECNLLGKITSIVDQLVLVESLPNVVPLDLDTILFLEKGQRPLGKVFDVMGQVHCPIYCVRFNSNQEIHDKEIHVGQEVFCAPSAPCTTFVILPELMKQKGSDASWKNDIEPPSHHIEYSDDEQERNALRPRRNQGKDPESATDEHVAPRNGHPGNHTYQYHRARRGGGNHHGIHSNRANSHHASHNYPRPNHHHMPIPNHMHNQPQYYNYPPPGPSTTTVYPNPFAAAQQDPRYYVNPFAYAPTVNYPPFSPTLFTGPPPPPPPPQN